jgi:hypothetical protein
MSVRPTSAHSVVSRPTPAGVARQCTVGGRALERKRMRAEADALSVALERVIGADDFRPSAE